MTTETPDPAAVLDDPEFMRATALACLAAAEAVAERRMGDYAALRPTTAAEAIAYSGFMTEIAALAFAGWTPDRLREFYLTDPFDYLKTQED